jgi:hypothetical protein
MVKMVQILGFRRRFLVSGINGKYDVQIPGFWYQWCRFLVSGINGENGVTEFFSDQWCKGIFL